MSNIIGSSALVSAFSGTIPASTRVNAGSYTLPALGIGAQSTLYLYTQGSDPVSYYLPAGNRYSYVYKHVNSQGALFSHPGGFGEYTSEYTSYGAIVNYRSGGSLIYRSNSGILCILYRRVS